MEFLRYLLYIDSKNPDNFFTEHCAAMKSGSQLPYCNRACGSAQASLHEIVQTISFFETFPFRWFVEDSDFEQIAKLEEAGLIDVGGYPAMSIELSTIQERSYNAGISIKEMLTSEEIALWVALAKSCYAMEEKEFSIFIEYLIHNTPSWKVRLYSASYENLPVASCMIIQHGDIASVHWVGTVSQFRGKGLGYAVSHKALVDAKQAGCTHAILFSSDMGNPMYEKIGFRQYAYYKVFGKK